MHLIDEDIGIFSIEFRVKRTSIALHFKAECGDNIGNNQIRINFLLFESGCFPFKHTHLQNFFNLKTQPFRFITDDTANMFEHGITLCNSGIAQHLCGQRYG